MSFHIQLRSTIITSLTFYAALAACSSKACIDKQMYQYCMLLATNATYLELGRSGAGQLANPLSLLESQESGHRSDAASLGDLLEKMTANAR